VTNVEVEQLSYRNGAWSQSAASLKLNGSANCVLVFGNKGIMQNSGALQDLKKLYANAEIIGCSTSGEICEQSVVDNSVQATAIKFETAKVKAAHYQMDSMANSFEAGRSIAKELMANAGLKHVFVLSASSS
jgi:hypothetical protein